MEIIKEFEKNLLWSEKYVFFSKYKDNSQSIPYSIWLIYKNRSWIICKYISLPPIYTNKKKTKKWERKNPKKNINIKNHDHKNKDTYSPWNLNRVNVTTIIQSLSISAQ